jgi:hypothetical protein
MNMIEKCTNFLTAVKLQNFKWSNMYVKISTEQC